MNQLPNPQQEPGIERRLLLVFALTFVVIVGMQQFLGKYLPGAQPATQPKAAAQAPAPAGTTPAAPAPMGATATGNAPTIGAGPAANAAAATSAPVQASAETETVIETDVFKVTFTNKGGLVKSWVLKQHTDDKDQPLDLVDHLAAEKYGLPLSFFAYDEGLRNQLNTALYVASASGTLKAPADLTYEYRQGDLAVRKSFHFDNTYVLKVQTSVQRNGVEASAYPAWPSGFGEEPSSTQYPQQRVSYLSGDKLERLEPKNVSGGATLPGPFTWAGPSGRYFAALFLPNDAANATLVTLHGPLDVPKNARNPKDGEPVQVSILGAAVGSKSGPTSQRLFVGPKAFDLLKGIKTEDGNGPDLTGAVDLGKWLYYIASPLFLWLKWTYQHVVQNWGWAIALQTLIINLALLPLRVTSMRSALKMQRLQPEMDAVKKKYEKYALRDPRRQEMNKEIGALMQAQGVNPIGGCLPLIIQMPFLIAYYRVLQSVFELRHAEWLWVHDLASPDPYHLLPIGVIGTMFLMQRLTPSPGMDPAQQKMMAFMMPVMLGFISWNLPAGLGLYWVVGSVIGIVQQQVMNRTSLGQQMREMAEKRARDAKRKK